ncbi:MAG: hypothetical protein A2381_17250 [Bdellovibrionales bacterium RIFOXYB1_FULL_37_110]|nr:MAG: hypothetical protein A2181_08255 [Bdellovibrionales bacterium RIFOXYA1_FULL_38_20]OFZ50142.1 MAG: hypothetical protein A2417_19085 [Bdellovibrionales bacterium RIFOXYC1_FULL_37_79]OFZ60048.1 MAG: hypothetical protein A2381_17250 [Bdellovibrionales bacterium RIFOXYB1_FULL_37_110]OFZ62672.1 MAG: hypothetical protein A2577_16245 [Bdellovibrionales bacterium RIFOXYD1_FULL_36_51]
MKNRAENLGKINKATFTFKDAKSVGLDYYDLKVLEMNGELCKVKRGIYQKESFNSFDNESFHNALAYLGDPSAICLLSAFYYYGLTDEIPNQVWVYVPITKYSHVENYKVIRKRDPKWNIGITNEDGFSITDINRTVIDALSDKKHVTDFESVKIARVALAEKKTSFDKLIQMAKKLGVYDRVKLKLTFLRDEYV